MESAGNLKFEPSPTRASLSKDVTEAFRDSCLIAQQTDDF